MILNCNSCNKKFVVPDQAITVKGRIVQCGSCGNKWKQCPLKLEINKNINDKKINTRKLPKTTKLPKIIKSKNKKIKKIRNIDLYSPEYLKKKHGISINDVKINSKSNEYVSFGFYNSLILLIVFIITFAKGLHFIQDFIVQKLPFTQFYLDYFFETIKNIFEIWNNLISRY